MTINGLGKFDITKWLLEQTLNEQDDEEMDPQAGNQMGAVPDEQGQIAQASPGTQPPQATQAQQEPTPQQQQQGVKTPFAGLTGETIKDISFKPTENGGSVVIKTDSPLPFIISWEGDSVTLKHQGITKLR